MRKVVKSESCAIITVEGLADQPKFPLVCYRVATGNGFCVLTKLGPSTYGFTPLTSSSDDPRYIANTPQAAINLVLSTKGHEVFSFNPDLKGMVEMVDFIACTMRAEHPSIR